MKTFYGVLTREFVVDEWLYIALFPEMDGTKLGASNMVDLEEISVRTLGQFAELKEGTFEVEFLPEESRSI